LNDTDWQDSRGPAAAPAQPAFRLRVEAVFRRVLVVTFVALEVALWMRRIRPRIPFRPRYRRLAALLYAAPTLLVRSILIAAIVTILVDLVFRAIVRPLMIRYYEPRLRGLTGGPDVVFRLEPGEVVEAEMPARRVEGRHERPGTLLCTDRRVFFCPFDWRADVWEGHRAGVPVSSVKARRRVLGLVEGYPDHIACGDGTRLAVGDPARVLRWMGGGEDLGQMVAQERVTRQPSFKLDRISV
jgi:hypothetical protein